MKLLFGGDICFWNCDPEDAREPFAGLSGIFGEADISVVNLENVFRFTEGDPIVKSGPNIISDPRFYQFIKTLNPTVVGLANNHTFDFGPGPAFRTQETLKSDGFLTVGIGKNVDEAYEPLYLEAGSEKFALIAVCENEFGCASTDRPGTAGYSLSRITKAISDARERQCRPIVFFHGGNERDPYPSPGKRELYRHFADLGADAVIACHTHCPQGYEYYRNKPIVYSMGNLFFPKKDESSIRSWYNGYLVQLEINGGPTELVPIPYVFDNGSVTVLDGNTKNDFLKYLEFISSPIQSEGLLQKLFDIWCAIDPAYVNQLRKYSPDLFGGCEPEQIKSVRNVFTCEAHNELVKNTLELLYRGELEKYKGFGGFYSQLRDMNIPTDGYAEVL